MKNKKSNNNLLAVKYIWPAIIIILLVHIIPIIMSISISFLDLNMHTFSKMFKAPLAGFKNYFSLLSNKLDSGKDFLLSLRNIVIFGLIVISSSFTIAMAVAVFLKQKFIGKAVLVGIILLPYFTIDSVAYGLWRVFFDPNIGSVNNFLYQLGFITEPILWKTSKIAMVPIIIATIWKNWPFLCLILSAGIQNIPEELYEAAKIDGANSWQTFFKITFPMLWPISRTLLILSVIWIIHSFNNFLVMMGQIMNDQSMIPSILIVNRFRGFNFGSGSAMSVILLIIIFIFTFILVMTRKEETV